MAENERPTSGWRKVLKRDIPKARRSGKWMTTIEEFLASRDEAWEQRFASPGDAKKVQAALYAANRKTGDKVQVLLRENAVYLTRK